VLLQGKMSRILAAKAALATRVDAMGSSDDATIGLESRAKVQSDPALRPLSLGTPLCAA
jgi:RNA processing factor Prp31